MKTRLGLAVLVAAVTLLASGLAPASAAPAAEPASSTAAMASGSCAALYAELPITGAIGKDVTADQVSAALKQAAGFKTLKNIVVKIKSPGGQPAAAKEISDLIKSYDGRFTFHASVEQAAGSSLLVALSCQTIHLSDSATLGGAAAELEPPAVPAPAAPASDDKAQPAMGFEKTETAPAAKSSVAAKAVVAAPVNLEAEVVAVAEAHGRSGVLARGLVGAGSGVFAWKDAAGKVQIADQTPEGIAVEHMIVTGAAKTVLSLTQAQAVALGQAQAQHGGSDTLGEDLGLAGWKAASFNLTNVMRQVKEQEAQKGASLAAQEKKKAENTEKRKKIKDVLDKTEKEAEKNDPKAGSYSYWKETSGSGFHYNLRFDMASGNLWKSRTDKCLADWNNILAGIKTMRQLEIEADAFGLIRIMDDKALGDLYDKAQGEIKRLTAERNNNKPPK